MAITFSAPIVKVNDTQLLVLPREASAPLPSRGQVMVKGTINSTPFQQALEPDGQSSHWIKLDESLVKSTNVHQGDVVDVEIETLKEWPEPDVPKDILDAVTGDDHITSLWEDVTPMARWEWIRWIQGTNNPETRKKRIDVSVSKLLKGMRRPCCFNRASCTDPSVSKGGVLINPGV